MLDKRDINNHRARSIIAYVSAAIVLVALVVLMGTIGREKRAEEIGQQTRDTPHKSDKDMVDNFLSHRSEFEKLLTMVMEDKSLYRVDYDWTEPEHPETVGISAARIDEYRKFMEKLGGVRKFV